MNTLFSRLQMWLRYVLLPICGISSASVMAQSVDYEALWRKSDSLISLNQVTDAQAVVADIRARAQRENNSAQAVKALLYQFRLRDMVEENTDSLNYAGLREAIATAKFPERNILQVHLGASLWDYYNQNRWQILQRADVADTAHLPADFRTWTARQFVREVNALFWASLRETEQLQRIPVGQIDPLLHKGDDIGRSLQPTLFDLLANVAIRHFQDASTGLAQPADPFVLRASEVLVPFDAFLAKNYPTTDTLSQQWQVIRLYQQLLRFHRKDADPDAFINAEYQRLAWLKNNAIGDDKEALIKTCYESLLNGFPYREKLTEANYWLGHFLYDWGINAKNKGKTAYDDAVVRAYKHFEAMQSQYPKSKGTTLARDMMKQIERKSLNLSVESPVVPNQPIPLRLDHTNLSNVYVRVVRITPGLERDLESNDIRYNQEKIAERLAKEKPLMGWLQALTDPKDYRNHTTVAAINNGAGLPLGRYYLLASDAATFSLADGGFFYSQFQVSGMAVTSQLVNSTADGYTALVRVTDRYTGKPLPGIKGEEQIFDNHKYEWKKTGKTYVTDVNGLISIQRKPNDSRYQLLFHQPEDEQSSQEQYGYWYESGEQTQLHFFLDRQIYRPGQTIYFKGLMVRSKGDSHELVTKQDVTVRLMDANSQQVAEATFTTNEFGSITGKFTAPTGGLTGYMTLQSEFGSMGFRVEEYKRPKFEATFEPVKGNWKLNETLKVTGKAAGYAGNMVDGATVKYRVTREVNFPYRSWWWPAPSRPSAEIAQGEVKTNEKGEFEVSFPLLPDPTTSASDKAVFTYTIHADVTDLTGETHSASTSVRAGYVTMEVSLGVSSEWNKGSEGDVTLSTENLAGQHVAAKGTLTIQRLKTPFTGAQRSSEITDTRPDYYAMPESQFRTWFPYLAYGTDGNRGEWDKEPALATVNFDTDTTGGKALPWKQALKTLLAQATPGIYVFSVATRDAAGTELKVEQQVTVNDLAAPAPSTPAVMEVIADRSSAQPGETATWTIRTSEPEVWAMIQTGWMGTAIQTQHILLKRDAPYILKMPVTEAHRGGISVQAHAIWRNDSYTDEQTVGVAFPSRDLKLSWETFRSKLQPGQKETWRLKITGPGGEAAAAELLAAMYDASLDIFASNQYGLGFYRSGFSGIPSTSTNLRGRAYGNQLEGKWRVSGEGYPGINYDGLNRFEFTLMRRYDYYYNMDGGADYMEMADDAGGSAPGRPRPQRMMAMARSEKMAEAPAPVMAMAAPAAEVSELKEASTAPPPPTPAQQQQQQSGPQLRTNLNETAFFLPQLRTDAAGNVALEFTMPEALTRWKFLSLAHTKSLMVGSLTTEVVTQKDLMVMPTLPRFVRERDTVVFAAKVVNMTESSVSVSATLRILDATTMQPVTWANPMPLNISLNAKQSLPAQWNIAIPVGAVGAIAVQISATNGTFSDGEENVMPVLTNRMLVTEAMPIEIRGKVAKTFTFEKLINSGSSTTLTHQKLTLEFTSNPAWYAVQALPYMMEYPFDCTEQLFSRFYANSLATELLNSLPGAKKVFETWRTTQPSALMSNLEKNEELKTALLTETPWLLQARDESERKRRVGLLFDYDRMAGELAVTRDKLLERQLANGALCWFPGMGPDEYMTRLVVTGFGHLQKLGVKDDLLFGDQERKMEKLLNRAVDYCDRQFGEDYDRMKHYPNFDPKANHLHHGIAQYLYMRSFYKGRALDGKDAQEAFTFYLGQCHQYWNSQNRYTQGMIALALFRHGDAKDIEIANLIVKGLKQSAVQHPIMGMYWKDLTSGYYWYEAPIETQSLLIEAFNEITNDQESVESMKTWLLKNKQTNDWQTTRATADACYALLATGANWLADDQPVAISVGGRTVTPPNVEAGTGHYTVSWTGAEITPEMGRVDVKRDQKTGLAWGALYWQYWEQMDKITWAGTPLSIQKEVFVEKNTPTGPQLTPLGKHPVLSRGDKVTIRVTIRVDRDMEYVHLKDMRAAGLEPLDSDALSGYLYKNGLGCYRSPRDASMNYFIGFLPKGVHVFEYSLRAAHAGQFSNGITTVQCMYAPEFTTHSEGIRLEVKE